MVDLKETRENPISQLWEQLRSVHAVMLGSPDRTRQLQPMAPQPAPDENCIWFYTKNDSELARSAQSEGLAQLCLISKEHDYWACLDGMLQQQHSRDHIDRFWSPVTAAWFDGGKDDPKLTMLRFTPNAAAIWASSNSTARFGWEIVKANIVGGAPDIGVSTHVTFPQRQ
jgi:general stress protein 26